MDTHQPLAYHDEDFLESTDARPIRILAEYLEPLRRFRQENIQDTVVFFGSARVHSRQEAERALRELTTSRGRRKSGHAAALKRGRAMDIPVEGVDLDDEAYTDVFVKNVSLWALMRQGDRFNKIARKASKAADAASFAVEWDRWENKVKGYARVQRAREEKIAAGIAALAKRHARVVAIVEFERLEGVLQALRTIAGAPGFYPGDAAGEESPSPP